MTFQKAFIFQKIEGILGYLKETEELFKFSDKEILADSGKLHIAERLLQLIVDAIIDINQHLIKELDLKVSEDFQGTFYILSENNILPTDFTAKIAPVVGLRNRIIHQYEKIDKPLFIATFRKNYPDFKKYLKFINNHLKTID
ncbi:MAG: hypothetical protein A3I88_01795 [Candidatus Portnoybacteria bacterium RIFCSPLOWO2_12_FULL_39_9]|nr:MAG: hypothetical protein A2646_03085 [Candidatus Portnoybacteria bacterium RIFCSPHIGHO2_02_FULL_39_12]OGZ37813.1 MAG: hypothetical protein A3F21_02660 [Candidatus Portnoybacteria bacterium RIFCSPLOWO2_01_FULL_38_39]OGZ39774.1 MAG: hypothetical protein A3I88_01795 [Candidatus Portnoybacteria bacterium RIFCSPLOWO2_12_FULL_39_9]